MTEKWSRTESVTRTQTTEIDLPDQRRTSARTRWAGLARAVPMLVPVVLVNGFAIYGQAGWAHENVAPDSLLVSYLFAAALESIAVYLAWEAHSSLMAGDAALKLRMASYLMAALVGVLNYSHWSGSEGWRQPTAKAVVFALFSVVSPWLWSIRSRSMRRADLRAQGLIDPRSVRFSAARWTLYPVRTFRAFRRAVWDGTTDPSAAIRAIGQTSRSRVAQTTSETLSVRVDVDAQTSSPDQSRDQVQGRSQTSLETTCTVVPDQQPRPARQTPRKAITAARTSTTRTRSQTGTAGERTIEDLVEEARLAVEAGRIPASLPVATAARELKVGKPRVREVIAAMQGSSEEEGK